MARLFLAYTLARLAMLVAIAGLLVLARVPPIVATLVAIVVALPLSLVAFRGLRGRLERAVADVGARRAEERAALRSELRGTELRDAELGDPPRGGSEQPGGGEVADRQPDGGGGGPREQDEPGLPQDRDQPPPGDPGPHPPHR